MFRSKTVFILGAGSSAEVGLPVGDGLKNSIAKKLNIKYQHGEEQTSGCVRVSAALSDLTTGQYGLFNTYLAVAWQLVKALPQAISIDNLLDAYREDPKAKLCGKLGIVSSILDAERSSVLYSKNQPNPEFNSSRLEKTWFNGFSKILTESVPKEEIDEIFENVSFINFNYDRCIEVYLYNALKLYYGLGDTSVTQLMQSLKVIRPYGSLGQLPWQNSNPRLGVPFGADDIRIGGYVDQIKTFNERIEDQGFINKIKTTVKDAEIIVFLGFAFHRQNLELLQPIGTVKTKKVYATTFGISLSDCDVIRGDIKAMLKKPGDQFRIELADMKCSDLFVDYWRSLSADVNRIG